MFRHFILILNWKAIVKEVLLIALTVLVINLLLPRSLVIGQSMQPSLYEGNRLAGSPLPYLLGEPQRGDIVMLHPVEDDGPALVKRLIGLPGDAIEFRDRQLYVNGALVVESYVTEACNYKCRDAYWELGADEYFVLGDNRNVSYDSRNYGPVNGDKIMAKVVMRWWPLTDVSLFKN